MYTYLRKIIIAHVFPMSSHATESKAHTRVSVPPCARNLDHCHHVPVLPRLRETSGSWPRPHDLPVLPPRLPHVHIVCQSKTRLKMQNQPITMHMQEVVRH